MAGDIRERKLEGLDKLEEKLFRGNYDSLRGLDPCNPLLEEATIRENGIFLQPAFFNHYGDNPSNFRTDVNRYYLALKISNGSF